MVRKSGLLRITGGKIDLSELAGEGTPQWSPEQQAATDQIGSTLKAYLISAQRLLHGKYAHLAAMAPAHLANPVRIVALICQNGLVVIFEPNPEKRPHVVGWAETRVNEIAAALSGNLIHCYNDQGSVSTTPNGPTIRLLVHEAATNTERLLTELKVVVSAVMEKPAELPQAPHKPYCLVSVCNSFELLMQGVEVPADGAREGDEREFVTRTKMRLPGEWECIEVYPFFDLHQWKPEYAETWAEHDLLAHVVAQQFRDRQFEQLDSKASARREYAEILKSYRELLDSEPGREEVLQEFLCKHPELLCPTHVRKWPKLALGAHKTDFVFREPAGEYLLVELEPSVERLFLTNGHTSSRLNHATGQITDWKRYLEDNLATVQRELGLDGISAHPRALVIMGRSATLTSANRRKLATLTLESPTTRIMTYDDVYDTAKAAIENFLGPLTNEGGDTRIYYLPRGGGQPAAS